MVNNLRTQSKQTPLLLVVQTTKAGFSKTIGGFTKDDVLPCTPQRYIRRLSIIRNTSQVYVYNLII